MGEEIAVETLKLGATDYILKSGLTRLVPAVGRALREAEQSREHEAAAVALQRSHDLLRAMTKRLLTARDREHARAAQDAGKDIGPAGPKKTPPRPQTPPSPEAAADPSAPAD
jgi:DNA-binding NtrC family response regulator